MLLERAAYDRLNSLKAINASKITEIEEYLTETRSSWIDSLNCCQSEDYKNQTKFRFLPGHKTILLAISEQIAQMNQEANNSLNQTNVMPYTKEQTDDNLMQKLITNLNSFMTKNSFPLKEGIISIANIRNFERGSQQDDFLCKCQFGCPFCSKVSPVKFKLFWMTSNMTKHLKQHIMEHKNSLNKGTSQLKCQEKRSSKDNIDAESNEEFIYVAVENV